MWLFLLIPGPVLAQTVSFCGLNPLTGAAPCLCPACVLPPLGCTQLVGESSRPQKGELAASFGGPPWSLTGGELKTLPRWGNPADGAPCAGRFQKNKACPEGEECRYAHGQDELTEWLDRREVLKQKLAKARKDMLLCPRDDDFGKYNFLLRDGV